MIEVLHRAALREGVRISTGATVKTVTPPAEAALKPRPSVTLTDGRTFDGHVIIGADGAYSGVRRTIETVSVAPTPRGMICYSGIVPIEFLEQDPDLKNPDILRGTPVLCGSSRGMIGAFTTAASTSP